MDHPTASPLRKRQRARKACLPCRKRKRKCDGTFPCSMCTTYQYTCQYPEDTGPAASFVENRTGHVSDNLDDASPQSIPRFTSTNPSHEYSRKRSHGTLERRTESIDGEESPSAPVDRGILDPVKTRYMGLHSAVAFPRTLGLDLQSANPPHLHSFAWNCGIRPEEGCSSHRCLKDIITKSELSRYSHVYFETVHPIFGILDQQQFLGNCERWWGGEMGKGAFQAVVAGVVALGSFFSGTVGGLEREVEVVLYAKGVLEDPMFSRRPTVDQVSAWVLRTVYLRATTRPHVAWLASCLTIHLAEATGLHHEMDAVVLATDSSISNTIGRNLTGCEVARKLFWSAWAVNRMISYEYGRSSVVLYGVTCKQIQPVPNDYTIWHVALAQLIPPDLSSSTPASELHKALEKLDQIPDTHPYISLSKADLCMCFYRRLRLLQHGISKSIISQILEVGDIAIKGAGQLHREGRYWWQVMCTVFQYVCVLLAIDTNESLRSVKGAMEMLERICEGLGTHVAKEACGTARVLLRDSVAKKRVEMELLERADVGLVGGHGIGIADGIVGEGGNGGNGLGGVDMVGDGLTDIAGVGVGDIDWDALLDPNYTSAFMPQDFGGFH